MTRRKIAQLVALVGALAVGLVFARSCDEGPVPVEIHYRLGDAAAPAIAALEVLITPPGGGPAVGRFDSTLISADVVQSTRLPSGMNTLEITVTYTDKTRRTIARIIEAKRDAVIRLELAAEVAAKP